MTVRIGLLICALVSLTGCVSYGNSKALITPVGIAGIHSFAPTQTPDDMKSVQRTARIDALSE